MTHSIQSASREWRNGLIDVGGNNRLLNYKTGASTLVLDEAPEAALEKLMSGVEVRLSELFPSAKALQNAQKACTLLARKQREAVEEYGISVTYLAAGMATWDPEGNPELAAAEAIELGDEPETAASSRAKTASPRAPVLIRPVSIELRRGAQQVWVLKLLDDFHTNGVLTHVLNADRTRIADDSILGLDQDDLASITTMQNAVAAACQDVADFRIDPSIVIGAFSYAKQPMVDDVSDLDALANSDIAMALSGDSSAAERVRATNDEVSETTPDYAPVESEFLVLDADASQSYVVNAALAGRNLVVEGPPGTGKSQTIANIIATSAAAGRTVLFVAQKRAAVSAVLDRLAQVDLDHLVLDVFAAASSRRFVADQLLEALDRQSTAGLARTDELHLTLTESRDRLVRHNTAMHAPTRGWGISIAEVMALSLSTPADVQSELRIPIGTLAGWVDADRIRHRAALAELCTLGALDESWAATRGWSPALVTNDEQLRESNDLLTSLHSRHTEVLAAVTAIAAAFELPPPTDWEQHDHLTTQLIERDRLQTLASATVDAQYSTNELHESLLAISREYRQRLGVSVRGAERRAAKRRAKTLIGHLPRAQRIETLEAAHSLRAAWVGQPNYTAAANWKDTAPAISVYRADLASLDQFLQRMSLTDSPLADLPADFVALAKDPRRRVMPRAHASRDSLVSAGLGGIIAELESRDDVSAATPDRAGQIFDRIVSSSLLDEALLFDADLATVSGEELHRTTSTFQRNDLGHLEANAVRIRRMAAERLKAALDANPEQHVLLKKEVTRKSRFTPVRGLLREIPEVILAAKPIWAMSPLQVSRLLPRTELFDLVIFDEASQVKPADAIPAILRGRQLIVAGDSRQLPPTEFFAKTLGDMDDDDEPDEDASLETAVGEEPVRPSMGSLTRDAESILFAMDRLLAGQSRRLLWHYRSRDERLIAVSNRYVYDSALTTFPAADTPDAITHIEVPFSPGIGGGTNSPEAEVDAVVEAVKAHARLHPDESLGVIAFGIKHQNRLESALEVAFAEDPELFVRLNAKEPFFVKSIERVQGDERDAIILTVGYGKSEDGQLRLFWGPLLQTGGDRRLNVAISRARLRLSLVSSFSANDLAEDGHSSRGYKLMYHFVRFVASAGTEVAGLASRTVELDAFEANVRDRLEAAGLQLDCQVGVGSYRIDFAVRHPSKPGVHVLAIEIDGAAYNSGHTARERDRLRQQLLERRGWVFHRIWSTDWFSDADSAVAAAVAAFDAAVERLDAKTADATDEAVVAWELPVGLRHGPRPEVTVGAEIDDYSTPELMEMVRWVRSDDVVRSSDDEITVVMRELGFERRGPKILRRIMDAQIRLGGVA